jgi:purine-nucleoside/S-methyl-5'-thioadenosine phosphorylase / adenosine deaminase
MPEAPDPRLVAVYREVGRARLAFTTRTGGISKPPYQSLNLGLHVGDAEEAVTENRRRVLGALKAGSRRLVEAEQVHGGEVAIIDEAWPAPNPRGRAVAPSADALVTRYPGVVLSLYSADCVPVFLTDGEAIGVAHAGWRGTAACVAERTVGAMGAELGVHPAELAALIGPCVGMCCYEVGEEVAEAVLAVTAEQLAPGVARPGREEGKWRLDLAAANVSQLTRAGVPAERIEVIGRCTCCERETFFSARADGSVTGRCGAFAFTQ